jgi:hypothetical protein
MTPTTATAPTFGFPQTHNADPKQDSGGGPANLGKVKDKKGGQMLRDQPRMHVTRSPRRKRDNQPNDLRRIGLGVCLGRGIGSSGVTDIVVDKESGRILGCVVLLDVDCFDGHTANSWATHKENLPFLAAGGISLDVAIADASEDTRAGALQFLLLHEFGHVLTADADFLPPWWSAAPDAPFPFLDLSWETNPLGGFVPRPQRDFDLRAAVDFYGTNKLPNDAVLTAYSGLEGIDFPSLYGATNPYDDFAECFATWVHGEMLGKPYRVRVDFDGAPQAYLDDFWAAPRSHAKRAFMQKLLGAAGSVANSSTTLRAAA